METSTTTPSSSPLESVVQSQLTSLDDTDCYATAWQEALERATSTSTTSVKWGGRGQGGRGTARRTFQPHNIVVDNVRLEYVGSDKGSSRILLDGAATLKLHPGRVYALIGYNGCGKSSLLRRIDSGKIPGFPPHVSTLYIPQEDEFDDHTFIETSDGITPLQAVLQRLQAYSKTSKESMQHQIELLEQEMEDLIMASSDKSLEEDDNQQQQRRIEEIGTQISQLDDELSENNAHAAAAGGGGAEQQKEVEEALSFMGVSEKLWNSPMKMLSPGLRKKTILATALVCPCDLLLLDEPTNLDVAGLIQLRRLISIISTSSRQTTVLLVSHDRDLINDVATDIIDLTQSLLFYYPGNYNDYLFYRQQSDLHHLRQAVALDKKRSAMMQTLENLKKQSTPKRGGTKKKARQIESHRKKIERQGLNTDEKGHRWTQQKAGTGIKAASINAVDASTRRGMTTQQLLELTQKSVRPPPDKAVQFVFRNVTSQWNEPLTMAVDVGHGYDVPKAKDSLPQDKPSESIIVKKEGYLFDCVDLCIDEGGRYCILGENGSGSSTLLKLLVRLEEPLEGTVKHALNLDVGFMDKEVMDRMIDAAEKDGATNALALLSNRFPKKTEQDIRGELTAFGLSPKQATTNLRFLSGGERRRLCLAALMLGDPQLLILDNPTSNLDMASVEALIYGLSLWNGTVVMASHDANFIRSLDAKCYAIIAEEGKLRRVDGGIDAYLRSFAK